MHCNKGKKNDINIWPDELQFFPSRLSKGPEQIRHILCCSHKSAEKKKWCSFKAVSEWPLFDSRTDYIGTMNDSQPQSTTFDMRLGLDLADCCLIEREWKRFLLLRLLGMFILAPHAKKEKVDDWEENGMEGWFIGGPFLRKKLILPGLAPTAATLRGNLLGTSCFYYSTMYVRT